MTRTSLLLSVACLLCSCGAPQGPISVRGIFPFVPDTMATPPICSLEAGDFGQGAFSLVDVAAEEPDARILVELQGQALFAQGTSQPPLQVGTRTLAAGGRDSARFERIELRYASRPSIPGITANTVDTIPFTAASGTDLRVPVPLFGREMIRRLKELPSDNLASFDVTVSFEIIGTMVLSGAPIRTESTPFPIRLVKSEVNCMGMDTRLARFRPNLDPTLRACSYFGLGQRFTTAQCCSEPGNAGQPGCEPQ
jgi:hypothetical protein